MLLVLGNFKRFILKDKYFSIKSRWRFLQKQLRNIHVEIINYFLILFRSTFPCVKDDFPLVNKILNVFLTRI